jgi:hypothetical protein
MLTRGIVALIALVLLSVGAAAQSTSSVMKAFGIIGAWSMDCSVDVTKVCTDLRACPSRLIFNAPFFGKPTEEGITPPFMNLPRRTTQFEFDSAERVTNDKIKLTYKFSTTMPIAGRFVYTSPMNGETWEVVWLKVGDDKIRSWAAQTVDGKKFSVRNGHPTIPGGNWNADQPSPVTIWNEAPRETPLLERCTN